MKNTIKFQQIYLYLLVASSFDYGADGTGSIPSLIARRK